MQKERDQAESYRKAAYDGDTRAMNNLGVCYHRGTGVKEDHTLAFEWYMKAALLDDAYGCFNVGECYYKGDGVVQDYEKALFWYLKLIISSSSITAEPIVPDVSIRLRYPG